ncbi:MAG: prepilin-type N-terminal cleavage/methylation domain-containing protein [Fuerstiella sp.]
MNTNSQLQIHPTAKSRGGVTLVEVLMALMIMSIGVASVAVLFPISVLRSIQATQLTNAAILKLNLETILDVQPELIFDPDGDGDLNEHFRKQTGRNYIVDPVGFYTHVADGNTTIAQVFGNEGTGVAGNILRWGGGLRLTNGVGQNLAAVSANEAAGLRLMALALANQGDGWETQIDTPPGSLVPGGVQLSTDLDLSQVPTSQQVLPQDGNGGYLIEDPELYRIVLFSQDGQFSQAFPLVAIQSNIAYFTEDINGNNTRDALEDVNMNGIADVRNLSPEFRVDLNANGTLEPGEEVVSRVLLQSVKISDYSWMLNVRRRSDGYARRVDIVVRFNNGVSAADERLFEATFVPSSYSVLVRLPSRVNVSDTTEPNIRKGKFIFDAVNGMWYRIQDVQPSTNANFDYLVTVQEQIRASDGAGTLASAGPFGWAMFPTGIVDVYPMGPRNIPDSLLNPTF